MPIYENPSDLQLPQNAPEEQHILMRPDKTPCLVDFSGAVQHHECFNHRSNITIEFDTDRPVGFTFFCDEIRYIATLADAWFPGEISFVLKCCLHPLNCKTLLKVEITVRISPNEELPIRLPSGISFNPEKPIRAEEFVTRLHNATIQRFARTEEYEADIPKAIEVLREAIKEFEEYMKNKYERLRRQELEEE